MFDLNDFDETLPGPWEWDVKRLATSSSIAARNNGFEESDERSLAAASVRAYRRAMRQLSRMGYLDVWYSRFEDQDLLEAFDSDFNKKERKAVHKALKKIRSKDSRHVLGKLAEETDSGYEIISQPPLIIPYRDLEQMAEPAVLREVVTKSLGDYLDSVPDHLETLLRRYSSVDFAVKVMGVGSIGTRCHILLLQGRDATDPLFLQIKEASRSVLEDHLPASRYDTSGQQWLKGSA